MKEILFATGNARKIAEATKVLGEFDIKVESVKLEMDEIQHHDPAEITKAKARAAYEVAHKPVVVSDTSWGIPALGGFPGGYMKDIAAWLDVQDWLALMARHSDKTIYCYEHVAYFDGEELRHFEHTYTGYFIDEPRGQSLPDESFEQVVTLMQGTTLAEQAAKGGLASAGEILGHWHQFGEWYSAQ